MPLHEELNSVLSNAVVERPSFFQLKHFIIEKECTTQGRLWQCLRELKQRKSWIDQYHKEIEEIYDKIELLAIDNERNTLELQEVTNKSLFEDINRQSMIKLLGRELDIKNRQNFRQVAALRDLIAAHQAKIADYEDEARFFLSEFRRLEVVEPLKPLDDLAAQQEYWTTKLAREINLKVLLQQPVDSETIKLVLTLPDDSPLKVRVVAMIEHGRSNQIAEGNSNSKT